MKRTKPPTPDKAIDAAAMLMRLLKSYHIREGQDLYGAADRAARYLLLYAQEQERAPLVLESILPPSDRVGCE